MHKQWLSALTGVVVLWTCAVQAGGAGNTVTDSIVDSIANGDIHLSFRYRYEFVDDDLFDDNAHASTLKSRLTFAPAPIGHWGFLAELDDVRYIGNDTFNNTRNGDVTRPLVADPFGTDLNQALVTYTGLGPANIGFGRQRIDRGNERFVGGHAWRQNEQTFDSLVVDFELAGPLQASYAYIFSVNRIYGPERGSPARDLATNIHLADVRYEFGKALNLSGLIYLMDFTDVETFSNSTVGIGADGHFDLVHGMALSYDAQYAKQQDYGDNPVNYDADYLLFEAALNFARLPFGFAIGYEELGAGNVTGGGFRTPLASLHKFQGWADRFAAVSSFGLNEGVEDLYFGASAQLFGGEFLARAHDFQANSGGRDWGTELDLSASWAFLDHYGMTFSYAGFDADSFGTDVRKFWAQFSARF